MSARTTSHLVALGYLFVLIVGEIVASFVSAAVGLALYGVLLAAMFLHAARTWEEPIHNLILSLTIVPIARLIGHAFPADAVPLPYQYLNIGLPLLVAVALGIYALGISWREIGVNAQGLLLQIPIALTGIVFGVIWYNIATMPHPLDPAPGTSLALLGFAIVFSTGFVEELAFRGLIQWAASEVLGGAGVVYVAALYALLHVGYQSWQLMAFVFVAGLFFGWAVAKTRNILGVMLAHSLLNILAYVVLPVFVG